jgi:hypothetical protein
MAQVVGCGDILRRGRLKKTRPAGTGLELMVRAEELGATAPAVIDAAFVVVPVFAGEGGLGAFLPGDLELLGRELLAPFGVGFLDFFGHMELQSSA